MASWSKGSVYTKQPMNVDDVNLQNCYKKVMAEQKEFQTVQSEM